MTLEEIKLSAKDWMEQKNFSESDRRVLNIFLNVAFSEGRESARAEVIEILKQAHRSAEKIGR
jgi:hypothetical protein